MRITKGSAKKHVPPTGHQPTHCRILTYPPPRLFLLPPHPRYSTAAHHCRVATCRSSASASLLALIAGTSFRNQLLVSGWFGFSGACELQGIDRLFVAARLGRESRCGSRPDHLGSTVSGERCYVGGEERDDAGVVDGCGLAECIVDCRARARGPRYR